MCATAASLLLAALPARADVVGYNTLVTPDSVPAASGLSGFLFRVSKPIQITQLGFYANSLGGGDTPHVTLENFSNPAAPVAIYDTGNILSSVPNNAAINYVSVGTPITLTPGITYGVVAPAYFAAQYTANNTTNFSFGPEITNGQFYHTGGNGGWAGWDLGPDNYAASYSFPTGFAAYATPLVTADFQYTVAAVPEPATYVGTLLIGGLFLLRRNRFFARRLIA